MELAVVNENGVRVLEAQSDRPFIATVDDVGRVIEMCLSHGARAALLYSGNLPKTFFDLSSGEAGVVLQKMRNYGLRLAVVYTPGTIHFSTRFQEAAVEERQGRWFGLFEDRHSAREWLSRK